MIPPAESYGDVGAVDAWIHDLEARWREEQERRVVRLEHGDGSVVREEILDWKPFRYLTWRWHAGFGEGMSMVELTPVDRETTHLSLRLDIMDPRVKASFLPEVPHMTAVWTKAVEGIAGLMQPPVPSA